MTELSHDLTDALYPFLSGASPAATEIDVVLAEVRDSTRQKARDVTALRERTIAEYEELIASAASAMARAFHAGGTLFAFGNGGSATDAQDAAIDCVSPPLHTWRPLPAITLGNDTAVLTAIANDVGFEHTFARQIEGLARSGDIALAFSTSGQSASVNNALAVAKGRGVLTIGFSGSEGGAMAREGSLDFCFTVRGEYVPRIQEAQATIWHALLESLHHELAALDGGR